MDAYEIKKAQLIKAWRTNVRLKYALMADEEINSQIEDVRARIEDAITEGRTVRFDAAKALEGGNPWSE